MVVGGGVVGRAPAIPVGLFDNTAHSITLNIGGIKHRVIHIQHIFYPQRILILQHFG